jgi:hypothetical protein
VSATRSTTVSLHACSVGAQQAAGRLDERVDRRPLAFARGAKLLRVAPAGHQLGVGEAQRIAGGKQLVDGAGCERAG